MVRTLESKDIMIEEERIFNDRLGELEDDKTRLIHQLETHTRSSGRADKGPQGEEVSLATLPPLRMLQDC